MEKPMFLMKSGKLTMFYSKYHKNIIKFAERCFAVKKPKVLTLIKGHLFDAVDYGGQYPILTTPQMVRYLHADNKRSVVVFWNGITDIEIVNRLKLPNIMKFLDTTPVENKRDNRYELVLKDISKDKQVNLPLI